METGILSETKYGKTRTALMKTSVFVTLESRFFIVELEPYTYEQFYEIAVQLLTHGYGAKEEIAEVIADEAWHKSQDIRDCVKIGAIANSIDDFRFLVDSF
jgi:hypothetical protein